MFDIRWLDLGYPNPLGDFFSRCGGEDHKKDILALDRAHRAILDDLATVKAKIEDFYIKDQTRQFTQRDDVGNIILTDIDIVDDVYYAFNQDWVKYHLKYRLGNEKSWKYCKLEDTERVVVRALFERQQELIESSKKLATEIVDLMSKGE